MNNSFDLSSEQLSSDFSQQHYLSLKSSLHNYIHHHHHHHSSNNSSNSSSHQVDFVQNVPQTSNSKLILLPGVRNWSNKLSSTAFQLSSHSNQQVPQSNTSSSSSSNSSSSSSSTLVQQCSPQQRDPSCSPSSYSKRERKPLAIVDPRTRQPKPLDIAINLTNQLE